MNRDYARTERKECLPLEGKVPQCRNTGANEVEPAVSDRLRTYGDAATSSVIRLAGDAGCHLPLQGKALKRPQTRDPVQASHDAQTSPPVRRGRRPRRPARGNRRFTLAPGRIRKTAIVPPGGRAWCPAGRRPPLRNGRMVHLCTHISDTATFRAADSRPYGGDGHFPLITHKLNGNPQANTHPRRCVFAFFN